MSTPAVPRLLDLPRLLAAKSHFLFGPRQTGKSHLVRTTLAGALVYDLLDTATYLALSSDPGRIAQEHQGERIVVIDEIQRLPGLLNEVHRLIETRNVRFLLTGSSARALRREGVNLLGGRARTKHLHPLTARELGARFDLERAIARGTIPSIYFSDDPDADLESYAGTYLREEIAAEGATRNVPAFSRFLRVAAACNATMVNFTEVSNDAQVPRTTVHEYFGILRDTLLLHEVPAWRETERRKPVASSKHYFFDIGVVSALQGRSARPGTPEFGPAFETWLAHELFAHRDYVSGEPVAHWRSTSGFEVDFVLGDHTAVEAKATAQISPRHLRGLRALAEEGKLRHHVCVCLAERPRRVEGGIEILPYGEFLEALWGGAYA
ncbi:MAG: ATP-binding protein [Planctomycetota bacterium]